MNNFEAVTVLDHGFTIEGSRYDFQITLNRNLAFGQPQNDKQILKANCSLECLFLAVYGYTYGYVFWHNSAVYRHFQSFILNIRSHFAALRDESLVFGFGPCIRNPAGMSILPVPFRLNYTRSDRLSYKTDSVFGL